MDIIGINMFDTILWEGASCSDEFHDYLLKCTMRALVDYAFENRKAERIIANIFVGNTASKNVVEKLGFKLEGIQRRVVMAR